MDFFLEIHNGECGLGGHFCDKQRDHGPSVFDTGGTQNSESRIQNPEVRTRKLTRRVHSPNYKGSLLKGSGLLSIPK